MGSGATMTILKLTYHPSPVNFVEDEYEDWIWIFRDALREYRKQQYLQSWRILCIEEKKP
jgi:hypothetical protein